MTNVLCDRHHAGLYRSLQLLADRLDWTLYTPHGMEWFTEGYWNFGRKTYGDDRLARQFLTPDTIWEGQLGTGLRIALSRDEEFPEADVRGIALADARELSWDIVIASLDDNQEGFARFARETGARYVVQCGNTGQYIAWSLAPFVLNSSEMPLLGPGVTYHQEMDPVFRWHDPVYPQSRNEPNGYPGGPSANPRGTAVSGPDAPLEDRRSVRSFVHLMNETHAFPIWNEMRAELPDFTFERFGHAPVEPDPSYVTNAKPIGRIAELMAQSGWGFHDKPVGDGFGHVIHGWAAIGRPLIGHASHYRGKLAGVFWRDLETCIDLDRHSVKEAVELIQGMPPEQHRAMCQAIRETFEANVDYEGETEMIRRALA